MKKYEPSTAEKKLFYELHLLGLDPQPQYKISDMHVDIAFPNEMLVIEVNGPHHDTPHQREVDRKRWFVLNSRGWKRRTFKAEKVHKYPKFVAEKIRDMVNGQRPIETPKEESEPNITKSYISEGTGENESSIPDGFIIMAIVVIIVIIIKLYLSYG